MASRVNYFGILKTRHKGFCLATIEIMMKYWPGGSYLVMKSTPRVYGGIPLMAIGYKYNFRNVLGSISTEGGGITEPGDPYLSSFPDIYSYISVCLVVCPHFLGRYFNACSTIDNHNRMWYYDLALDKYWVTQNGYFRLTTTVALGMGVIDRNLQYYDSVAEVNVDKKILSLEYNNSKVYDFLDNPFTYEFGSPYLYLPPITIDDRPRPHK